MNPLEALTLLDQAVALGRFTKQEHIRLEQAVQVLKLLVEKKQADDKQGAEQTVGTEAGNVSDVGGGSPAES